MLREGVWLEDINLEIFILLETDLNRKRCFYMPSLTSPFPSPLCWHSVISCCICSDLTCMWPLHIPVNNHTLQHGYWFVTVNPARSFSPIHWLSRNTWTNRSIWTDQSVYGRSRTELCLGVEEQHPPLHLPQHHPLTLSPLLPPTFPPAGWHLTLLTCVHVCVCVFGSMAVTALERQRISSGSWMPSRHSSGTCTGPRRSSPNTSRVASSSCRATWSRTASSGVFACLCAQEKEWLTETKLLWGATFWEWILYYLHFLYYSTYKYFICIAAPGWHLSPSWQRAASPQISAFLRHYAQCSMWW